MDEQARIEEIGAKLAALGPDTDSNDWPDRNQILYAENNPMLWVQVCEYAQQLAPEDDVVRIWLRLEEINGLRRTNWDADVVSAKLAFVRKLIDKLDDDDQRKKRLLGLWAYHGAMVFHADGKFAEAADCHAEEARLATDERGRALAIFNQRLEEFNAAATTGIISADEVSPAACAALELLSGDSSEDIRWRANIQCHVIFCSWMYYFDETMPRSGYFDDLEQIPDEIAPAFASALPVIWAIEAFWARDYAKALKLADSEEVKGNVDWHGNALLVQLAIRRIQHRATRQVLAEINGLGADGYGGHLAKAVSKHISIVR